jgi:hypothetical protein
VIWLVAGQGGGELALDVEVDVVADVDLDLQDRPALEREAGRILLADRVAGVVADRQALAAEGEVAGLGLQRASGDNLVIDVQLGGAVGLVALAELLLAELDAENVAPG